MKSKKNIKSIVLFAILGIAALFFINMSFAANNAKINVETADNQEDQHEIYEKIFYCCSEPQGTRIILIACCFRSFLNICLRFIRRISGFSMNPMIYIIDWQSGEEKNTGHKQHKVWFPGKQVNIKTCNNKRDNKKI